MKPQNQINLNLKNKGVQQFMEDLKFSSQENLDKLYKNMPPDERYIVDRADIENYIKWIDVCSFTRARWQIMKELEQANPLESTAQAIKRNTTLATISIFHLSFFEDEDCPEGLLYKKGNEIYQEQVQFLKSQYENKKTSKE